MGLLKAKVALVVALQDENEIRSERFIAAGELVDEADPIVAGREDLFEPLVAAPAHVVVHADPAPEVEPEEIVGELVGDDDEGKTPAEITDADGKPIEPGPDGIITVTDESALSGVQTATAEPGKKRGSAPSA